MGKKLSTVIHFSTVHNVDTFYEFMQKEKSYQHFIHSYQLNPQISTDFDEFLKEVCAKKAKVIHILKKSVNIFFKGKKRLTNFERINIIMTVNFNMRC